jgi:hypothetical protein
VILVLALAPLRVPQQRQVAQASAQVVVAVPEVALRPVLEQVQLWAVAQVLPV